MQSGVNLQSRLQQVFHALATNPDPLQSIALILQSIQDTTAAAGVCYAAPDESGACITSGDIACDAARLRLLGTNLAAGLQTNPLLPDNTRLFDQPYLAASIRHPGDQRQLGMFCLVDTAPAAAEEPGLVSLLDALTAAAVQADYKTRQGRTDQLTAAVLSSLTDPLIVVDADQNVLLLNPAAETLFHTPSKQAAGRALKDVVQSDELMSLISSKSKSQAEWHIGEMAFIPRTEAIRNAAGETEGWILSLRDITRFKRLNRNQNEFTRIVSHDLRSPLTSMQGFADMLQQQLVGELNEKQAFFVEKILSGVHQMATLVENIQDAGRYDPETGFYELSRSACDLREIINRIVDNHLVPAEKEELKLSWHVTDNLPIVYADIHMLERAITNLIDNAIKYTPNGGSIHVDVRTENESIVISVKDTGYGISPENQKRLFERHVRLARKDQKRIKGSGLGLFIVRSVAQRHGGDAWVRSAEDEGSTFYMSIPLSGENLVGADAGE